MFLIKFRKKVKIGVFFLISCSLFVSKTVYAFSVDSMVKVSDKNGNGVFTLTSSKTEPEYINGSIEQVEVIDGGIKKTKLTKDNLPIWDLALLPTKVILYPGEMRRVGIKNLCQKNCNNLKRDKVYQISFKPSSLSDDTNISNVGINFGYAPYFIVPAEEPKIEYDFSYENDTIKFKNSSNTFLYVQLDNCTKGSFVVGCKKTYTFLSGREKDIKLDEQFFKLDKIKMKIANHDYEYNEVVYASKE
ncbi:hypothetical protein [Vibrio parahaemolyticus]|uniref:hypothetical protein n=1 Tax=Vibrio parahaemolyticus TaxID=670 RepID=UPI0004276C14|nr:hypothetical protein [Vibrio parahaemolyticus]MBE3897545.1 hypothetical protein [Vibrio parahaemolyticus]